MEDTLHCPNCGLGFTLRQDYLEHMRCYLPGARPYVHPHGAQSDGAKQAASDGGSRGKL